MLVPILRSLLAKDPDYKSLALLALTYLGYEELGYVLAERRQDWKKLFEVLHLNLKEDPHWARTQMILGAISQSPQELDQIAESSGLNRTTVSQTINALDKGGYPIAYEHTGDSNGRPRKAFYIN